MKFAVSHTAVYFVAGVIFAAVMNYQELFASAEYIFMRPFDHPLVILGWIVLIIITLIGGAILGVLGWGAGALGGLLSG